MATDSSSSLEKGVAMVLNMGLSTGHADSWLDLLDEVLDQYQVLSGKNDDLRRRLEDD